MASQLAISLSKHSTSPHTSTPAASAAAPASAVSQVFGEMPTPNFLQETHGTDPRNCSRHHNPIQNSGVSNNITEQNLDIMPQQYDFPNLTRRTVFPEPVFDVYDDETEGCSSKSVDVFADTPGQQIYEEEPQRGEPLLKCLSKALEIEHTSACVNIISDVPDFTLELQQQDEEKVYSSPVIKDSNSSTTRSSELNIEHGMRELRLLWDPGASTPPYSSKFGAYVQQPCEEEQQECEQLLMCLSKKLETEHTSACVNIVSDVHDFTPALQTYEIEQLDDKKVSVIVQQPREPQWNALLIQETRKEWDPGEHPSCSSTQMKATGYCSVKCISWLNIVLQYTGDQVEGLKPLFLTTPWDPGVRILQFEITCNSTRTIRHDEWLKFSSPTSCDCSGEASKCVSKAILSFERSAATTVQVTVEFCLMDEMLHNAIELRYGQLAYTPHGTVPACYSSMLNSIEAIYSARCMSTATTLCMFSSGGKIAKEGRDACCFVSALLPSTQFAAKGSNNNELGEFTSRCMSLHQQGVKKSYNAKNLLSSPNYLQI